MSTATVNASSSKPTVFPLDELYRLSGRTLPRIEAINGDTMPEPYKSLLVHNHDMTSTLEKFHSSRIHLRILSRRLEGSAYFRESILQLDGNNKAVEFGAIKINLDLFDAEPRRLILEQKFPLGRILNDFNVTYSSSPKTFFKIEPDAFIIEGMHIQDKSMLYGRCNVLADAQGKALAEIVEILPPQ